jgi:hypothetical protein
VCRTFADCDDDWTTFLGGSSVGPRLRLLCSVRVMPNSFRHALTAAFNTLAQDTSRQGMAMNLRCLGDAACAGLSLARCGVPGVARRAGCSW